MAEACYTARATMKQQVIKGIGKLALQMNEHGQYTHDAILLLQKGIRCILVSQFNPSDPGKGKQPGQRHGETAQRQNEPSHQRKIDRRNHGAFCPQSSKGQSGCGLEGIVNIDHTHHHLTT